MDNILIEGFRLSPQQRRVWLLQQAGGHQPFYVQATFLGEGRLDRAALAAALRAVAGRHEILRTTFQCLSGMSLPLQVITEALPELEYHALCGLTPGEQAAQLDAFVRALEGRPFDVGREPPLAAALIGLAPERHVLLLRLHALCADRAALDLLVQELAHAYAAVLRDGPPADAPMQYVDLAEWQNELIESEETEEGRAYWRRELSSPYAMRLPFERRAVEAAFAPLSLGLGLPAELGRRIMAAAGQHGVPPASFLMACWYALLWRLDEQADLSIAVTYEGRKYAELERALGPFARSIPLRCSLAQGMVFGELVRRVDQALRAGDEWQEYFSWELLDGWPAGESGVPFAPMGFEFAEGPARHEAGGIAFSMDRYDGCAERFSLTLACTRQGDTLAAALHYDASRFTASDIEIVGRALGALLASAVERSEYPIETLSLAAATGHDSWHSGLDGPPTLEDHGRCFHEIFAEQARRTPDQLAIAYEEQRLTYGELHERTNRLAHYLRALGVGPETRVGLRIERSAELLVGMLGILKAGGAYVPLDPALPEERLAFMLRDVHATVLLTAGEIGDWRLEIDAAVESPISNLQSLITVDLVADWERIAQESAEDLAGGAGGEHLAYVLFTSGSTGTPKGVAVEHRQLSAYLAAILERLELPAGASFALVSTVAADLGNTAIFPALASGGCLHSISAARAADPDAMAAYMRGHAVDCLKITPSHLRALLTGTSPADVLPRQRLILGGEAADWDWAARLAELAPQCRIMNHYGPTETTVGVLTYAVEPGARPAGATRLPLGRALAGAQVYVLDRRMEPLPPWFPGELHIGGATVARGYLNRPELTAERFVPDPFGQGRLEIGDWRLSASTISNLQSPISNRLYKTGDRGRYRPDGTIEFLGRADDQVKIRGFRVELGEIAALLSRHGAVREAVVLAHEETPGDARIVAYVVPRDWRLEIRDSTLNNLQSPISKLQTELRDYLKTRLPDYMIPAAFVLLEALPLTPNGKVDRRALPAPPVAGAADRAGFVAPRTPTEEALADIWTQLLGVERIGAHDSFFDLGGHSLLATQLVARIRNTFQVELPLRGIFDAPTLAGLAEQIGAARAAALPPIQPAERNGAIPLSLVQQGIWFVEQFATSRTPYVISLASRIDGPLDVDALQRSLDALMGRHEALRTTFPIVDGRPGQLIAPVAGLPLDIVDLAGLAEDEREREARRRAAEDAGKLFDLARDLPLRVTLLRLAPEQHVLLVAMHHLISDGWSQRVLIRELVELYRAFCAGAPPALPALPIQYADYSIWQRQWLRDAARERLLDYWRQRLAGAPQLLALPADRPRPTVPTYRGATSSYVLPPELVVPLQELSRQEGVTLFMTTLAAFQVLLARYSGQDDILVGTPIANRTRAETEGLIGLFINTLVLRTDLSGTPTFRAVLGRVRETCLGAYAHQDLPFDQLVEALRLDRDLSYNPLFQVMFMFQTLPASDVELPQLKLGFLEEDAGAAMFDLTLGLMQIEEGLACVVEYSTDLFDQARIDRLAGHLQTLLEQVARRPDLPIGAVPLLTPAEERELAAWNATGTPIPTETIVGLLEAQAARTPDAVALLFDHRLPTTDHRPPLLNSQFSILNSQFSGDNTDIQHMTYRELNERANQLAHHLRGLGVGPEARVGICMERSAALIVGLLGILKAGGAYVPLDPAYPPERTAWILADAQVPVLLTNKEIGDWRLEIDAASQSPISNLQSPTVVDLVADRETIAQAPETNPAAAAVPENLAYVIYTSGSTGRPKGVAIEHRSAAAFLAWARATFSDAELAGVLAATSICFDLSVFELFAPLSWGGTVILAENVLQLPQLPAGAGVTLVNSVPSAMTELLRIGALPPAARTINLAGEPLPLRLVQQLYGHDQVRQVGNLYGPSETTTYSTATVVPPAAGAAPTIGRPIANTQVYLLDAAMQQVPVGVPGELYIGGAGLARGYLNRPDLTAQRFVPNPFTSGRLEIGDWRFEGVDSPISNLQSPISDRLYRTGDLARYLPDGDIEFLGRRDQQIKLRGFRIELGEIEAALRRHASVREAAVVVREDAPGMRRLVAYVVVGDWRLEIGDSASSNLQSPISNLQAELRGYLKTRLPDYMIPATFVTLEALPLTPNGKIDRAALPADAQGQPGLERPFVAPRSPTEEVLADIWAAVLGVARAGIHDHFFELGGHSLLVTQVVARVRDVFQVELPLRSLFEEPILADLALRIDLARNPDVGRGQEARGMPTLALHPAPRTTELPLSFAQQRMWFLTQLLPDNPYYNIAAAVRLTGQLDLPTLERALDAIVARHEALRTTFAAVDGRPQQVIATTLPFALAQVDLRGRPATTREAEMQELAGAETRRPFDLARGPLTRATLLRLADDQHVLLITAHHIVSDGWSIAVFIRELGALYAAMITGEPAPLPELPVQYADYAIWQRQWLQGAGDDGRSPLQEQLAYWQRQLRGSLPVLDLPTDYPRPAVQTHRGATRRFVLAEPLVAAIKAHSIGEGATLFMTLLAAFQTLLHRYSGQTDIAVGTPIAGRTRPELEGLIGLFVNTLVLRSDLAGAPTFRALLRRVRAVALDAYAHQDLPFEMLVEALQPERDMSHNPLFQVMFALQNMAMPALVLPNLTLEGFPTDSGTAKFDLWLSLREDAGELFGALEYNTELFAEETIARMIGHYGRLLESIAADPDRSLADLAYVTEAERRQLAAWQGAELDEAAGCLHLLFEAQAQRTPDAVALVFDHRPPTADHREPEQRTKNQEPRTKSQEPEDTSAGGSRFSVLGSGDGSQFSILNSQFSIMTYAELNERANRLAHHLRALGVGPEVPVGICTDRSAALLVGLLGILKAGGAYVPLDPTYPTERLAFMLADSKAPVLLTNKEIGDWRLEIDAASQSPISNLQSPTVVYLDADWNQISRESPENLDSRVTPDNLSYLIYTSGSTGRPKGVAITHRSAATLVSWALIAFTPAQLGGVLAATSICFDLSVFEIFVPLSCGGIVILADNPLQLPELPAAQQVTLINSVPSALAELLRVDGIPASARTINMAGEQLPLHLVQQLYRCEHIQEVVNLYGPSEDTTYSTWAIMPRDLGTTPPIGRPIAGTQAYLLDQYGQPVPLGVAGELYLGGAGLARGYLGQPDLTAERFVPNPFSNERLEIGDWRLSGAHSPISNLQSPISERLYRTGDLCRQLPDGTIVFLGRVDQQVKLRGFRIELGEIEATLHQHKAVHDAVAIVREDTPGDRRLVAYIVPGDWRLEIGDSTPDNLQSPISNLLGEQVESWQQVFDSAYHASAAQPDPTFNIAGWNSSYTGQPLPAEQMRAWVEHTVARIRALRPQRVLEIGCGTGLLLFRLAPDCEHYCGTDFSRAALEQLRPHLEQRDLAQVELLQRAADDFDGLAAGTFDVVVINSVAQYFPGVEYLLQVLEGAARLLAPGGAIFLGDLRSLPLLEIFHTAVELHQAPPALPTAHLRQRVQRRLLQEQELTIDPAFFAALRQQLPQISSVDVQLKRGRDHNELTKFRYDVTLHARSAAVDHAPSGARDWSADGMTLAKLRQELSAGTAESLRITGIPNARLAADVRAVALLVNPDAPASVGALRETQAAHPSQEPIDPEDVWALATEFSYDAGISWSNMAGCFDVVFRRPAAQHIPASGAAAPPAEVPAWSAYANNPLRARQTRQLVPVLRAYLKARLPSFMVPAAFVLLDALPLTPNGKVDREALPPPVLLELAAEIVAPRTPLEQTLAAIWAEVLGLELVGVEHNFFALGGDSILSLQIIARARQAGLRITPQQMFQHQTVAELAAAIAEAPAPPGPQAPSPPAGERTDFPRAKLNQKDLDKLIARIGKPGKRRPE